MPTRNRSTETLIKQAKRRLALSRTVLKGAYQRVRNSRRSRSAGVLNPQDRDLLELLISLEDGGPNAE